MSAAPNHGLPVSDRGGVLLQSLLAAWALLGFGPGRDWRAGMELTIGKRPGRL